ncbi:hypothetical protein GEMRC1_000119 [Eukaryota sp. GEM-RC1]
MNVITSIDFLKYVDHYNPEINMGYNENAKVRVNHNLSVPKVDYYNYPGFENHLGGFKESELMKIIKQEIPREEYFKNTFKENALIPIMFGATKANPETDPLGTESTFFAKVPEFRVDENLKFLQIYREIADFNIPTDFKPRLAYIIAANFDISKTEFKIAT